MAVVELIQDGDSSCLDGRNLVILATYGRVRSLIADEQGGEEAEVNSNNNYHQQQQQQLKSVV